MTRVTVLVALMLPSMTSAVEWQTIGPNGGRVDGFVQCRSNPDRMYALPIQLGVWRSDDRGLNWDRVDVGIPLDTRFEGITVSPTDEDVLLIVPVDGGAILRSTNGGTTWASASVAADLGQVNAIEFATWDASLALMASEGGTAPGIHLTTDAGATWTIANTGLVTLNPKTIAYHPVEIGEILTGTQDGVFRSTDSGTSWTQVSATGSGAVDAISFSPPSPSRVWAGRGTSELLRSDDGGATFIPVPTQPTCEMFSSGCAPLLLVPSPTAPGLLFVYILQTQSFITEYGVSFIYKNYAYRTTDAGTTWQSLLGFGGPIVALNEDPASSTMLYMALSEGQHEYSNGFGFNHQGPLHRSTNGGTTWQPWGSPFSGLRVENLGFDTQGRIFARSGDRPLRRSTNGTWVGLQLPTGVNPGTLRVDRSVPGAVYSADLWSPEDAVVSLSSNGGDTWIQRLMPVEDCAIPYLVREDGAPSFDHYYVWAELWNCSQGPGDEIVGSVLGYPTGSGFTFQVHQQNFFAADAVVSPTEWTMLYSVDREAPGLVRLSTSAGAAWEARSSGLPPDVGVSLFLGGVGGAASSDVLTVVHRDSGVHRSFDGGLSWSPVPLSGFESAKIVAADWDPATDRFFLATVDDGVYVSGLGFVNDGLRTHDFTSIAFDAGTNSIALGTEHASVWHMPLDGGVDVPVVTASSDALSLRAMPNPFASSVRLEFSLPADARDATLAIYSVDGRRIATLAWGNRTAGSHAFTWDGRNAGGKRVPAGVYFARLEADGHSAAKRIVLLGE